MCMCIKTLILTKQRWEQHDATQDSIQGARPPTHDTVAPQSRGSTGSIPALLLGPA